MALRTLALAAAGGGLLALAGFPGGWLTGSIATIAIASLAGLEISVPAPLRIVSYAVIGLAAGSAARPETLAQIWTWPVSFLVLAILLAVSVPVAYAYLRRFAKWDPMTALLASFPGSLSLVVATAEDIGADVRRIVISQTLRVMLLLLIVPIALPWLDSGSLPMAAATQELKIGELVLAFFTAMASGLIAQRLKLPGGLIVGALLSSMVLFASGLITTVVPPGLFAAGLVVLGAIGGGRFQPGDARLIGAVLPHSVAVFCILVSAAIVAAYVTGTYLGIPVAQALMAYAPGALEAMIALAFISGVDAAFVGAHHVMRFFAISVLVPTIASRQTRSKNKTHPDKPC